MSIKIKLSKFFYIITILAAVFFILVELGLLPFSTFGAAVVSAAFIIMSLVNVTLPDNIIISFLINVCGAVGTTYFLQFIVGANPFGLSTSVLLSNILLNLCIFLIVYNIANNIKIATTVSMSIFYILGFIDYAVISFRDREITISDLFSLKTAASVAARYEVRFTSYVLYSTVAFIFALVFLWHIRFTKKNNALKNHRLKTLPLTVVSIVVVGIVFVNSPCTMHTWRYDGIMYNGLTFNFGIEIRDTRVSVPENYDAKEIEKIAEGYEWDEKSDDTPNVIVIMNESFADLSVLGDIETSKEMLPYLNSLGSNKALSLTSVFGGSTACVEWEFLTGMSQAYLPMYTVAYQQYIRDDVYSIVDVMKENNYKCIAMHPFYSTGWNRNNVYNVMGFDEMYFIDELDTSDNLRGFVTDESFYEQICDKFESKEKDEKYFMFCITMQNHGGYYYGGFDYDVTAFDGEYRDVNEYLSLAQRSDEALEKLIDRVSKMDEKTVVLFFGDHQPALSNEFYGRVCQGYTTLDDAEKKYYTPYVIYKNYDDGEEISLENTSVNFLPIKLLKEAKIPMSPYFKFLEEKSRVIPMMNYYGYYSDSLGRFAYYSEATGKEKEALDSLKCTQYNAMFDKKNKCKKFFD